MTDFQVSWIEHLHFHFIQYGFNDDVAAFIACQFALESSFGDSDLAIRSNNYSGMRVPLVRLSVASNQGDASSVWSIYSGLEWCICDFILCLQFHQPTSDIKESVASYCRFISRFYCPERNYITKITDLFNQFKNYQKDAKSN